MGYAPSHASRGRGRALYIPYPWPQRRLGRRLEEVAKAVGGGYRRLRVPLTLALGVRETVAGHRLGALEGGGGASPFQCIPGGGGIKAQWVRWLVLPGVRSF